MVKLLVSTCLLVLTAGHSFGQQLTQSQCPDKWGLFSDSATADRPAGNSCTPGCEECDKGVICMYPSNYNLYQWDVGTCRTLIGEGAKFEQLALDYKVAATRVVTDLKNKAKYVLQNLGRVRTVEYAKLQSGTITLPQYIQQVKQHTKVAKAMARNDISSAAQLAKKDRKKSKAYHLRSKRMYERYAASQQPSWLDSEIDKAEKFIDNVGGALWKLGKNIALEGVHLDETVYDFAVGHTKAAEERLHEVLQPAKVLLGAVTSTVEDAVDVVKDTVLTAYDAGDALVHCGEGIYYAAAGDKKKSTAAFHEAGSDEVSAFTTEIKGMIKGAVVFATIGTDGLADGVAILGDGVKAAEETGAFASDADKAITDGIPHAADRPYTKTIIDRDSEFGKSTDHQRFRQKAEHIQAEKDAKATADKQTLAKKGKAVLKGAKASGKSLRDYFRGTSKYSDVQYNKLDDLPVGAKTALEPTEEAASATEAGKATDFKRFQKTQRFKDAKLPKYKRYGKYALERVKRYGKSLKKYALENKYVRKYALENKLVKLGRVATRGGGLRGSLTTKAILVKSAEGSAEGCAEALAKLGKCRGKVVVG